MRLNISSWLRFGMGPDNTTSSDLICANTHTSATLNFTVTSGDLKRTALTLQWITIPQNLCLSLAITFKWPSIPPALALGINLRLLAVLGSGLFGAMLPPYSHPTTLSQLLGSPWGRGASGTWNLWCHARAWMLCSRYGKPASYRATFMLERVKLFLELTETLLKR